MALQVGNEYLFAVISDGKLNLKTGSFPKFEWFAIGVGNIGDGIQSTMAIGLLNTRVKDFLVSIPGNPGSTLPLRWDKDNKSAPYLRGRLFLQNLRKLGLNPMADLVKGVMKW